jgi:hypothetical protein
MQTGHDTGPPFDCDLGKMRELFAPQHWRWPARLPERVPHPSSFFEQPVVLERV